MILDEICNRKLERLELKKRSLTLKEIEKQIGIYEINTSFEKALRKDGISIIGEAKKASPSKGILNPNFNIEDVISKYNDLNVSAISVLTEENYFKGSIGNLVKAKFLTNKPILRKDFIIDIYELYESKFYGADTVLLIAAILDDDLSYFYRMAVELGFEPLVEVHDEWEVENALNAGAKIIGINNRNLRDFKVDIETTRRLKEFIPSNKLVVSESGVNSIDDIQYISSLGVDGVLIGEFFMRNMFKE